MDIFLRKEVDNDFEAQWKLEKGMWYNELFETMKQWIEQVQVSNGLKGKKRRRWCMVGDAKRPEKGIEWRPYLIKHMCAKLPFQKFLLLHNLLPTSPF